MKRSFCALLTGTLLLNTGLLWAQDEGFDGFYMGAGGGYSWQSVKGKYLQFNLSGPNAGTNFIANTTIKQQVGIGQLFIGYGLPFNEIFYGAVETSFNAYTSPKYYTPRYPVDAPSSFIQTKVNQQYGFQFSLLPGLFATPSTLVYGRVGYGIENYQSKFKTTVPLFAPRSITKDSWASELILGVGINQYLNEHVSLRLEYDYLASAQVRGPAGVRALDVASVVPLFQYSNTYHLNSNSFLITLIYNC